MLLVAEATQETLTRAPDDLAYVDEFEVHGREATLKAWSLPDPAGTPPPPSPAVAHSASACRVAFDELRVRLESGVRRPPPGLDRRSELVEGHQPDRLDGGLDDHVGVALGRLSRVDAAEDHGPHHDLADAERNRGALGMTRSRQTDRAGASGAGAGSARRQRHQ